MRPESAWYAGLQYRPPHHTEPLNMQIKRLLDDRLVVIGDKLINSQGQHCEFVEHANGQLVAVSPDGKKVKSSPVEFG